jgi:hypothetical protein
MAHPGPDNDVTEFPRQSAGAPTKHFTVIPGTDSNIDEPPLRPGEQPSLIANPAPAPKPEPKLVTPPPKLPPDIEPPTRGWPSVVWWWAQLWKLRDKANPEFFRVPTPNTKELAQRAALAQAAADQAAAEAADRAQAAQRQKFWYDLCQSIALLQGLVSTPGMVIDVATENIKGQAGKSTLALLVGEVISWFGGREALVLHACSNATVGDLGTRANVPDGAVRRIGHIFDNRGLYSTPQGISNNVPSTPARLRVIAEDLPDSSTSRPRFTNPQYRDTGDLIRRNFAGVIIFDTGNDSIADGSIAFDIARRVTVLLFCSMAHTRVTQDKMAVTIAGLRTAPLKSDEPEDPAGDSAPNARRMRREDPNTEITTQEKVANSVVVVSGVRPGEVDIDFDRFTEPANQSADAVQQIPFQGATLTVPEDAHLNVEKNNKVNIFELQPETLLAILRVAIALFEQAAKMLKVDLSHLKTVKPDLETASLLLGRDIRTLATTGYPPEKE